MKSGIYTITAPSGGQYVGSAVDIGSRWRQHRHDLKREKHCNRGLQRASRKYGFDRLVFSKLIICNPLDLIMFEQRAIDVLRPRYNACLVAGSQLGRSHSAESNAKNAASHRGRTLTPEHKAKISLSLLGNQRVKGRTMPMETRAKISAANKGRGPSAEHMKMLHNLRVGHKIPKEEIPCLL